MTRYRLAVLHELPASKPPWCSPPEYPGDAPTVSGDLYERLTRRWVRTEDRHVTFNGGSHAVDLTPGQLLCDPDPAVQALGEEWMQLIRWCVANTNLTDLCRLEPVDAVQLDLIDEADAA